MNKYYPRKQQKPCFQTSSTQYSDPPPRELRVSRAPLHSKIPTLAQKEGRVEALFRHRVFWTYHFRETASCVECDWDRAECEKCGWEIAGKFSEN